MPRRIAILDSHPIQYHVPWYRELARRCDLSVLYAHDQTAEDQARAGYGVSFQWDVDLTSGYCSRLLTNVSRDPGLHWFGGCDTPELYAQLARERYDAVIATGWYLKTYWQAAVACKRSSTPIFVRGDSQLTAQTDAWKAGAKRMAYPLLLRAFDGYLSVGQRNCEYLKHFRVAPERIFHVPHAVDVARFEASATHSLAERDAIRSELGATSSDRVALYVGRLVDFKRPLDIVEALAASPAEGASWLAVFVGAGPLAADIERRAAQLGVRVRMLGFRNQRELPRLYAAADVLVLPSTGRETWGLVVNEAMACGLPAVVSDAAGCAPDMIDPARTGYTFACGDIHALAASLERARDLRSDEHAQAAMQDKSLSHSAPRAAEATLDAVEAVLAAKVRAR